eukprot:CAMPEP_0178992588 /NCGR_PEP_ID=MMETSP0795-20121207/6198_1 /TAXON_ID=88552 /ORGANISM="Amoebophrya sp., Strain Ameob2" /LENGTH=72 /DNA_ID=CAMNT_0020684487 /DNA_START=602 /DNA_END=820 /DNA_ORIENTATION=-
MARYKSCGLEVRLIGPSMKWESIYNARMKDYHLVPKDVCSSSSPSTKAAAHAAAPTPKAKSKSKPKPKSKSK